MARVFYSILFCIVTISTAASASMAASGASAAHAEPVIMGVGDQTFVKIKNHRAITVTNPQVIRVFSEGPKLHVVARHPGRAEITWGTEKLSVVVYSSKLRNAYGAVSQWIDSVQGLKLRVEPERLIVTGEILRFHDWQELHRLRRRYESFVTNEARPSEIVLKTIHEKIQNALRDRSITSASAEIRDGEIKLTTSAVKKPDQELVRKIADDYDIATVDAGQSVDLRPMVEIEILIAEVKKNAFRTIGLKTPGVYSATVLPSGGSSSAAVNFDPINTEVHALFQNDQGRVLANPKLVCRSGEKANFVAGGEIPLKLMNWRTQDVVWKKYGVILEIQPVADMSGAISTQLVTEISLLDDAHKVDGIPGLLTNRIETHFDIRGTKTIALSGLIKSELGRNTSGIPLLGEIPILGELFKSRDYRDNRTELVVFVTPRLIPPDAVPEASPKPGLFEDDL
jgi:pilus assembly protein CpaC